MKLPFALVLCGWIQLAWLSAEASHLEYQEYQPQIISHYRLIDVGETDVDPTLLSKLFGKLTFVSDLNDAGLGIANNNAGGFVFLPTGWKYAPQVIGMGINFHAINQKGDLLISLTRGKDSVEWMVWPWRDGGYGGGRKHIHTTDPFKSDFFLTGFNETASVVGFRKKENKNVPIIWSSEGGIQRVGERQGIELHGIAKAINDAGSVVGFADEIADRCPFFWKESIGVEILKNYRNLLNPKGWVEFADMVLTNDDTIYGTFWIRYLSENNRPERYNPYYAYMWTPKTGKVDMLDLQGMRIAAVNASHVLVGTLNGKAVVRELGKKPVELAALIEPQQQKEWELIEGSAINNKGQIVGYGTYRGKKHIFFADPTF